MEQNYKSGFVNIIGLPNAGKSTLLNALLGEKISIVTPKVQTTRHRIIGILTGKNYQIVFSDTPGILEPKYMLQEKMLNAVNEAIEDADILLYIIDINDDPQQHKSTISKLTTKETPTLLIMNKIDLVKEDELLNKLDQFASTFPGANILPVSALHKFNLDKLMKYIVNHLPEHPPYFPEDQITDRSERFIASEIIREKVFAMYRQEIPYSTEIMITGFNEEENLIKIYAEIVVNRKSQKPILIGKGGKALKATGTEARKELERFFNKKVFLELFVKVRENWRDTPTFLRSFGYE